MKRNKIAFVAAIMLMISVILTGCSPQEISYYETLKRLSYFAYDHKLQEEGKIKISINQLGADLSKDKSMEAAISNINKYALEYTATTDYANNTFDMAFFYNDGQEKTDAFAIKRVNDVMYIKIGKKSVELFGALMVDEEQQQTLDLIDQNGGWVAVSDAYITDQLNTLADAGTMGVSKSKVNNPFDLKENRKVVDMYMRLYDNLVKEGFVNLDLDTVKQNGNVYTTSLDGEGLYNIAEKTALYTIDNNKAVSNAIIKWMISLDSTEMKTLGLDDKTVVEGIQSIAKMAADTEANKSIYKTVISSVDPKQKEMALNAMKGTKIDVKLTDNKDSGYLTSINYTIKMQDPMTNVPIIDMGIVMDTNVKSIETVKIDAPTSITLEKLAEIAPTWLNVESSGSYTLNSKLESTRGEIPVMNKDGVMYVGAKDTAKLLNENVQWNAGQKKVFVEQAGSSVYFDTLIQGNTAFIKVKDLQNLGYSVKWNAEGGYAKISKNPVVAPTVIKK